MNDLMIFEQHESAESRFRKGRLVSEYCKRYNVSKPVFYERKQNYLSNNGLFLDKKPIIRMDKQRYAQIVRDVITISMLQKYYFNIGVEEAARICNNRGLLQVANTLSRSQISRYQTSLGISTRLRKQREASIKWKAEYSYQIFMCDASPMEQFFMNFKGEIILRRDLVSKDKHTMDKLEEKKLTRVWGFYMVDVFSGAYQVYYIACAGESSNAWMEAFAYFFTKKKNPKIPLFGIGDMLYTDLGSGLHSIRSKAFLKSLNPDIVVKAHPKGKPESKGRVEGRIGAWKKRCERIFHRDYFRNIQELQETAEQFLVWDQTKRSDKYKVWAEGLKDHPVKEVSLKNVEDAMVTRIKRQVDAYRCVVITGKKYRIPVDVPKGEMVDVFWRRSEAFVQLPNGTIHPLNPDGEFSYTDKEAFNKPARIQLVNAINKDYKEVGKEIRFEDILPDLDGSPENYDIPKGIEMESHSAMPVDEYSVDDAVRYTIEETGMDDAEFVEMYKEAYQQLKKANGKLTGADVRDFTNSILKGLA